MSYGLRLIVKVRKVEAQCLRLLFEVSRAVLGVGGHIVAADGYDAERLAGVIFAKCGQALLDVLHIGAMGADEHHQ